MWLQFRRWYLPIALLGIAMTSVGHAQKALPDTPSAASAEVELEDRFFWAVLPTMTI